MTHCYGLADVSFSVQADSAEVVELLDRRLRILRAKGDAGPALVLRLSPTVPPLADPTGALDDLRTVYDPPAGEVLYSESSDLLVLRQSGRDRGWSAPRRRCAWIDPGDDAGSRWRATHPLATLCLSELLRSQGLFPVHAAALSLDGRGLLVAGRSGSGKSTLALALLRAGFGFLGDDTCFVRAEPGGMTVYAFPDEIDVADATVRMFPELEPLLERPRRPGAAKRPLLPEEVYPVDFVLHCRPDILLFPVRERGTSRLEPMSATAALLELAPGILLTHRTRAQAHLDALGTLVAGSRCFRLFAGQDFEALPERLAGLLDRERKEP